MEPVLISALAVALAEIGDQTQLLAILLATRFRKPWPIVAGILCATIANHLLAATVGYLASGLVKGRWLQYLLAASFFATALWALKPDKAEEAPADTTHMGVFMTTLVSFFLLEIGDKTQIATIALAARFHSILLVTTGTTLGMMVANVPAVFLGHRVSEFIPMRYVRFGAAGIFVVLGIWTAAMALRAG